MALQIDKTARNTIRNAHNALDAVLQLGIEWDAGFVHNARDLSSVLKDKHIEILKTNR